MATPPSLLGALARRLFKSASHRVAAPQIPDPHRRRMLVGLGATAFAGAAEAVGSGWRTRMVRASASLQALALTTPNGTAASAGSSAITGATAGSTLTLVDTVGGLYSINSATRTLSWSSSVIGGRTDQPIIRETLGLVTRDTTLSVAIAATGTFSIAGNGYGDSFNNAFLPIVTARPLARSLEAGKANSAIYLQEECCAPYSPAATSFIVGGPDVGSVEAGSAAGTIELTAAALTLLNPGQTLTLTVTPVRSGVGTGAAATITVYLPTPGHSYFVDYGVSTNTGTHGTWGDPMKYMPGTQDYGGSAKTFGAGDVVFFRGIVHRTALVASKGWTTTFNSHMSHAGSTGNPVHLELGGWGGRAQIVGDDIITVSGTYASQAAALGNPDWALLKTWNMSLNGGALEPFAGVFSDDALTPNSKMYRAQWPTPANLAQNKLPDPFQAQGSERFGMRNVPCKTSGGTTRMYTNGGPDSDGYPAAAGIVTIVDPGLMTEFPSFTNTQLNRLMILTPGNHLAEIDSSGFTYDNTTGTIVIAGPLAIGVKDGLGGGQCAYAVINCVKSIKQAGQYAISADGLTLATRAATAGPVSVGRRWMGCEWGMGGYIRFSGGVVARFANSTFNRAGQQAGGGAAFHAYLSGYKYECDIVNVWMRQCYADDSLLYGGRGTGLNTAGFRDSNVESCLITENECSFARFACTFDGSLVATTEAQITAYAKGKWRWNSIPELGINQSGIFLQGGRGFHITMNSMRGNISLHGDGMPIYENGQPNIYFVVDYNEFINASRAIATDSVTTDRHAFYTGNFILAADLRDIGGNAVIYGFGGEIGGEWKRNLAMNYTNNTFWLAMQLNGGGLNVHNNVIGGLGLDSGWTGDISNNLFTNQVQSIDHIGDGGTHTGNIQLTGVNQIFYFQGFTAQMISTLGAGQIGVFRTI